MSAIAVLWALLCTGLTAGLTAPPVGLGVTQSPGRVTVLRGQTAALSCHFTVRTQRVGFQWFRMDPGPQLIVHSARHILLENNQSSSLLITEAAPKDSGKYYCQVNVPYHTDPEWGNGTMLTVLAPPSSPTLFLQTPADPQIDSFSLACVTWGFYPSDLSLYWTNGSAASPIDRLSITNCTLSSSTNITADPLQSPRCVKLEDTRTSEVYLISVVTLPDRRYMEAELTYVCVVEGHPTMTEPLTASYTWEAPPNLLIGVLNVLKMCFLSAVTGVFSLEAVKHWCS